MFDFLQFNFIDLLDVFIVAYLFYQFFLIIRGTTALSIFVVIVVVYFFWLLVRALNMQLLSSIIGNIMGVGVIAILVVFQQEVRRFLLMLVTKGKEDIKIIKFFNKFRKQEENNLPVNEIITACDFLRKKNMGALIILSNKDNLTSYFDAGQIIDSKVNALLLETIFFKNTPLHDGATFIIKDKIRAAACVLPLTERTDLPNYLGLRHRAAIGITEVTDTLAVVVSEERGQISISEYGKIFIGVELSTLKQKIEKRFQIQKKV